MGALQYIYTSSKKGYGVYSKTIGLSLDECKQITINSRYVRPQELTGEDIVDFSDFPVKLSRFKLRNHRWVISQSVYLGKDNTGRQGNYFTHGLVFEKEEPVTMSILNYKFRTELTEMEFNNTSPAPLSEISNFPLFNKMNLMRFVNDNRKDVERIIDLFLESQQSNKKLVILDENKKVIQYINVLFNLLPSNVMKNIEFSSYVERITNVFDIVGVYNNNMRFDNRLILFEAGSGEETSTFSQSLVNDYLNNTVRKEFLLFANALKKNEIHDRIRVLYDLFSGAVVNNDVFFDLLRSLPNKDEEIVTEVIDFVVENEYSKNINLEYFKVLMRFVGRSVAEEKYFSLIKECASNGNDDIVQEILKYDIIYSDAFLEFCSEGELTNQLRTLLIGINASLLPRNFYDQYFTNLIELLLTADEAIQYSSKDVIEKLLFNIIPLDLEYSGIENVYMKIIKVMKSVYSDDEVKHYLFKVLNQHYGTDSDKFPTILLNAFRLLFISKGFGEIQKFLFPLQDKRKQKDLRLCLDTIHSLLDHIEFGTVTWKEIDRYVFKYYNFYIELQPRWTQKAMFKKWYKFNLTGRVLLKPNYILIFGGGSAALAVVILGAVLWLQSLKPVVVLESPKTEYYIYDTENIESDLREAAVITDLFHNNIASEYPLVLGGLPSEFEVDTYRITFEAFDRDGNKSNMLAKTITILPDEEAPLLTVSTEDLVFEWGEMTVDNYMDLLSRTYTILQIEDNSFDDEKSLYIDLESVSTVDFSVEYTFESDFTVGYYPIRITVLDRYSNEANALITVKIEDTTKPEIISHSGVTEVELDAVVTTEMFTFISSEDVDYIGFEGGVIDTSTLGEVVINVFVEDTHGLRSELYPITVTVVEGEEPSDG